MTCNPVVWFEIYVQEMARAKKFYEAVFGLTLTRLDSPIPGMELWSFPMTVGVTGATGTLVKMDGKAVSARTLAADARQTAPS